MNISGMNPGAGTPDISGGPASSGENPRLRSLEQKLQQLTKEKKEALANQDTEKAKALEKEIQSVKQQIQELKEKEKKKKEKKEEEGGQKQPAQLTSEHMLNRLA
ncbi:MAG: hypothetical protein HFI33_09650 [Lachnospiraceae bacterium]|nr:hypothetical protein [Lachnospiraceae bacterium]